MKKNPLLKFIKAAESNETDLTKLYNLDVNKKGKRNIIEEAHPDVLVAFDSYDALNGVIKNQNQAQDVTINILNRRQHGILTNEIFSSRASLITSLVKTANMLELQEPGLALYADNILKQLDKEEESLKAEAAVPAFLAAAAPYILVPAAVVGLIYFLQHTDKMDLGMQENVKALIEEIDDILKDNGSGLFGRTYSGKLITDLTTCSQNLKKLLSAFSFVKSEIARLAMPVNPNVSDLMKANKDPAAPKAIEHFEMFANMSVKVIEYLVEFKRSMSSFDIKELQINEKGFFTKWIDEVKALSGGKGLIKDDIDDVIYLIGPTIDSIRRMLQIISGSKGASQAIIQAVSVAESASGVKKEAPKTKGKKEDSDLGTAESEFAKAIS